MTEKKLMTLRFYQYTKEPLQMGEFAANRMESYTDYDVDYNILRHMVETRVLAEHLASDTYEKSLYFSYPATTWQMFKNTHAESWWLGWLVRRRPVKMHEVEKTAVVHVDRYLKYPAAEDVKPFSPRLGPPVIDEMTSED